MDGSFIELNYFLVWPLAEAAMGVIRTENSDGHTTFCLVGASPYTTLRASGWVGGITYTSAGGEG